MALRVKPDNRDETKRRKAELGRNNKVCVQHSAQSRVIANISPQNKTKIKLLMKVLHHEIHPAHGLGDYAEYNFNKIINYTHSKDTKYIQVHLTQPWRLF